MQCDVKVEGTLHPNKLTYVLLNFLLEVLGSKDLTSGPSNSVRQVTFTTGTSAFDWPENKWMFQYIAKSNCQHNFFF